MIRRESLSGIVELLNPRSTLSVLALWSTLASIIE